MHQLQDSPEKREIFCERFHERVCNQTRLLLENTFVGALDYIVRSVDPEQPQRLGVIVEGSLQQRIKGHIHPRSGLKQYSVRMGRTGRTSVYVPPPAPDYLDAHIKVRGNEGEVAWRLREELVKVSSFHTEEYFTYTELRQQILEDCSGLFLSVIDGKRRIRYANTTVSIPTGCKSSVFLTVHHRGELYHFNLSGKIIFPATGTADFIERQRLEKAARMYEAAKAFKYESYQEEVVQYLVNQWEQDPHSFDGKGRLVILYGRHTLRTGNDGNVSLRFIDDNGQKSKLVVSCLYPDSEAEAEFIGNMVFFHHGSGLLNAYKARGIGFQRSFFTGDPLVEYIALRNISPESQRVVVKVDGSRYAFSLLELEGSYNTEEGSCCAILYHKRLTGDPTFQFVALGKGGPKITEVKPHFGYVE